MKLSEFQNLLKKYKYDAYVVTRGNMFIDQDILPEENKIMELTGFTGSAAQLIVMQDKAVLLVDGRYEIQSKLETDPALVTVKVTKAKCWNQISQYFPGHKKIKIAYDPWCHTAHEIRYTAGGNLRFVLIEDNRGLLGSRLSNKVSKVFEHDIEYAGISRDEKIADIVKFLHKEQLDAFLFTAADSVSWLLNLRSDCLPDTPIIRAFALVDKNAAYRIFGDGLSGIAAEPLDSLKKALKKFKKDKLGMDILKTPQKIALFQPGYRFLPDKAYESKAVKNAVELQGIKNAHKRDALAMVRFLHWFDNNWQGKTELDIVAKLHSFREQNELFYSNSFETIAGSGSNGAIVHYQPDEKSSLKLQKDSMLLLDSGAQYYDGTTDITRTIATGTPAPQMINDFTTVLKCHIELASAIFPETTNGTRLDAVCRRNLWAAGKDYNHGTGHGVGCFLNVHEGPQNISAGGGHYPLFAGMVTSIEPGYYKEGAYGIRIENLVYVEKNENPEYEIPMLKFEPLTLVPIDKRLINKYLLSEGEIGWLNEYHAKVWNSLKESLNDEDVLAWLEEACSPL